MKSVMKVVDFREIPEKPSPIHTKARQQAPNHAAGFRQNRPKSAKKFENQKNSIEEEKPLKKNEILDLMLGKEANLKEAPKQNTQNFANKDKLYEGLIGNLEENVEKIRLRRQLLQNKIQKIQLKTHDYDYEDKRNNNHKVYDFNEDFGNTNEEKHEENWTERLFSTKPSLQNIENIVQNQRKNLEQIENLYKMKKSQEFPYRFDKKLDNFMENNKKMPFDQENLEKMDKKIENPIENNDKSYDFYKNKHKQLDKQLKETIKPSKPPVLFSIKVKTPQKNSYINEFSSKNYEESPTFGENEIKKNLEYEENYHNFRKSQVLKEESENFYKNMQKPQFDNWRKSENYLKKSHSSQEGGLKKTPISHVPVTKFEETPKKIQEKIEKPPKPLEIPLQISSKNKEKEPLLAHIFKEIDKESAKIASKQEVFDYLMGNEKVRTAFDLKREGLYQALEDFPTERPGLVKKAEFISFIQKFPTISQQKPNIKKSQKMKKVEKMNTNGSLIEFHEEIMDKMREVFVELDKYEDFIVKRKDLLKKLKEDGRIMPFLEAPVVTIPLVQKSYRLNEILEHIEKESVFLEISQKIAKEYITWSEFLGYFNNTEKILKINRNNPKNIAEKLLISEEDLMILRDLFDSQPRVLELFVQTGDFVMEAKKDPLVKGILTNTAREYENIGEFLDRVLVEAREMIEWDDVLGFLGVKGQPADYVSLENDDERKIFDEKNEKLVENLENSRENGEEENGTTLINQKKAENLSKFQQNPKENKEISHNYDIINDEFNDPNEYLLATRKPLDQRFADKYYQLEALDALKRNAIEATHTNDYTKETPLNYNKISKKQPAITVPKPPSFLIKEKSQSIRQRKVDEMVKAKQDEEKAAITFQFKAKDVPAAVKMPKLDNLILNEAEKKAKRAEKITETKPFNFDARDQGKLEEKKKALEESMMLKQKSSVPFKAREIPQSCRNLMFEELEKKAQEERKARVEARVEENKSNIKGFERMKEAEAKKKMKEEELKKEVAQYKFKPDLEGSKKSIEKLRKEGKIMSNGSAGGSKNAIAELLEEDNTRGGGLVKKEKRKVREIKKKEPEIVEEINDKIEENVDENEENPVQNEENQVQNEENNGFQNEEQPNNVENQENQENKSSKPEEIPAKANPSAKNDKSQGFQHKQTKKQVDMQKLKEKEELEKKKKAEEIKKQEEERKAKEQAMKLKVNEKFPPVKKPEKKPVKPANTTEETYEKEKKQMEERMANKPLMIEDNFHRSKVLSRYKKMMLNPPKDEEKIEGNEERREDNAEVLVDKGTTQKNENFIEQNDDREENNEENVEKEEENKEENVIDNQEDIDINKSGNDRGDSRTNKIQRKEEEIPDQEENERNDVQEEKEKEEEEDEEKEEEKEEEEKEEVKDDEKEEDKPVEKEREKTPERNDGDEDQQNQDEGEKEKSIGKEENEEPKEEENEFVNINKLKRTEEDLPAPEEKNEEKEEIPQNDEENLPENSQQEKEENDQIDNHGEEEDKKEEDPAAQNFEENANNEEEIAPQEDDEYIPKINKMKRSEEEIVKNEEVEDNIKENKQEENNEEAQKEEENEMINKKEESKQNINLENPEKNDEIEEDLNYDNEGFDSDESPTKPAKTPKGIASKTPKNESEKPTPSLPSLKNPTSTSSTSPFLENINPSSKLYEILSYCISTNQNYIDKDFPATLPSLCKDPKHAKYNDTFKKVSWLRPKEIFKTDAYLLFDKIDPNDISQGSLGDCYFLATCAAIAEFPERVQKIFLNKVANPFGAYAVTIYVQGVPQEIIVDDQIPCLNGQPLFTKPVGNELWVMLIEKAWAKIFNCYTAMEGGLPDLAMEHLLGCPAKGYSLQNDSAIFSDKNKLFSILKESDLRNHVICAGSKGQGEVKNKGIVSGHAYTIISVYDKNNDYILKMRNPWGSFEWEGKYKEDSSLWTKALIKELEMVKANDGVFFMTVDEFLNEFDYLGICFYEDHDGDRNCFNIKTKCAGYFELENKQDQTDFQISLHQTLKDLAKTQGLSDYKYSPVDLELFQLNSKTNKYENCLGMGDSQRFFGDSSILINDQGIIKLAKGKYLIRGKIYWPQSYMKDKTFTGFNLTVLGPKGGYSISKIDNVKGRGFLKDFLIYFGKSNDKNMFEPKKAWFSVAGFPGGEEIPRVCIVSAGNDEKNEKMELTITLKNVSNLRLKKETMASDKSIQLSLNPGTESAIICKTVEKNRGYGFEGLSVKPSFSR